MAPTPRPTKNAIVNRRSAISVVGRRKVRRAKWRLWTPGPLPALPSVTKVYPNGRIEADVRACARCEVDADRVNRTIEILSLNVERLRVPRERRWRALSRNWSHYFDDPDVMESAACSELLPDQDGDLPRFFTTNRSYFGSYGERLLEQDYLTMGLSDVSRGDVAIAQEDDSGNGQHPTASAAPPPARWPSAAAP